MLLQMALFQEVIYLDQGHRYKFSLFLIRPFSFAPKEEASESDLIKV